MILHPSRSALLAFQEGHGRRSRRVARHLSACTGCRARLVRLRALCALSREVTAARVPGAAFGEGASGRADIEASGAWSTVSARLDAGSVVILPAPGDEGEERARRRPLRRVAAATVAALTVSAAGVAALTLTPLGSTLWRGVVGGPPASPPQSVPSGSVEVAVPEGGLTIRLTDVDPALHLRLVPWDEVRVALVPSGGAGQLDFRSSPSQVRVSGASKGILELRVPVRGAPVRVLVRGVTVAVVHDGWVHAVGLAPARTVESDVRTLLSAAAADPL